MPFTVKYRTFEPCVMPPDATNQGFTECDRIDGPYDSVSTRYEGGYLTVYATRGDFNPGMTYGPVIQSSPEEVAEYEKQCSLFGQGQRDQMPDPLPGSRVPRPTLWVMNDAGATIAKYDL